MRAIVALAIVTPISIAAGVTYARDRTTCQAVSLGLVALFFWCWAVSKNVAKGELDDLGMISFASVLLAAASTILYKQNDTSMEANVDRARRGVLHLGFACALVTANYVYVLQDKPELPEHFRLYLAFGATWWLSAFAWTVTALRSYARSLQSAGLDMEAEALMNASAQGRFRVLLAQ